MAFRKGDPRPAGAGRKPGQVNRQTKLAREAIARFVDGNADRLESWLEQIEETDGPMAAFRCFMDVVEYHVPKLARSEVVGDGGGALTVQVVQFADGHRPA